MRSDINIGAALNYIFTPAYRNNNLVNSSQECYDFSELSSTERGLYNYKYNKILITICVNTDMYILYITIRLIIITNLRDHFAQFKGTRDVIVLRHKPGHILLCLSSGHKNVTKRNVS